MQVAAEDDVGHDDGTAAKGDICGAGDGTAAGYFIAGVLGGTLVVVTKGDRWKEG